ASAAENEGFHWRGPLRAGWTGACGDGPGSDERTQLERLVAARSDADGGDRSPRHLLQSTHVPLRILGEFGEFPDTRDVLGPPVEVLVHGGRVVELGLRHGDLVVVDPVDVVADAHRDTVQAGE